MKPIIILQARTGSSRLPGKALMDIGGLPMVVLAQRRASNTGLPVIVATSTDPSDDNLVKVLKKYGVSYFRGNLSNVLDRFIKALADSDDDTIVIRLTADNVFPDGKLLDELVLEFTSGAYGYLCCNGLSSGLPYGVSAELMYLKDLREAAFNCMEKSDLEHVTPYIKRKYGSYYYKTYLSLVMGNYRCTVDCLDDFLLISEIFDQTDDPIGIEFLDLISLLKESKYKPLVANPAAKLVLGTAQFGMEYGIANHVGKPELSLAKTLLKTAVRSGVEYIDTARSYGDSEFIIGGVLSDGWSERFKVITKLPHFNETALNNNKTIVTEFVDAHLYKSLYELKAAKVDVVLLHNAKSMSIGGLWERLLVHIAAGRISLLGVSVQSPEELLEVISVPEVSFLQLPLNLLDWRWSEGLKKIAEIKKHREIKIHARSIFLQGLLLSKDQSAWIRANVNFPDQVIRWLEKCSRDLSRDDIADLCYSYVNSIEHVDGIVVGLESEAQLHHDLKLTAGKLLSSDEIEYINLTRPFIGAETLNPSNWNN